MTVAPDDLVRLADEMAVLSAGFGNEMVVAWPVLDTGPGEAVFVSAGDEDAVDVLPARVFRYAVTARARGVVIAHNHPRSTGPSESDRAVTRRLVAAGRVLDVPLLAHLVVEPDAVHELVTGTTLPADGRPGPRTTASRGGHVRVAV